MSKDKIPYIWLFTEIKYLNRYSKIVYLNLHLFLGDESYENYERHAGPVFQQLKELQDNGFEIDGIHNEITVIHTSDWKAAACIDGNVNV